MSKRRRFPAWTAAAVTALGIVATVRAEPSARSKRGDWPMWGGSPDRNMVSDETGIPDKWDIETGLNIKWKTPLGSQTYGNPTVAGGRIFVGTNNNGQHRKGIMGDKGVVLCLDEQTGKMLWQATHDKLPTGRVNDWPEQGICSSPYVDGDRVYYVSNRCELVCADVDGFLDGKNDGPFKGEKYTDNQDADFIWKLDMIEEVGAFPHNLATSSPVGLGNAIYLVTGNGVDEGHLNLPSPFAPSFLAVDKKSGQILWENNDPGEKVLHGQWSAPSCGVVNGKPQVFFPGGDGLCYALDPKTGDTIWKFDLNPPDSKWELGRSGTRNNIIATPVFWDNKIFLGVGQDPEHGEGIGHLYAIDARKTGDATRTAAVWHRGGEDFNRTMSTVAIKDGLLYAADLSGFLYCLDVETGRPYWIHDVLAAVWGSPYVVDQKVFLGDEDGEVVVLKHGKSKKLLAEMMMGSSVYTTPVAANGVLYVATRDTLYAIAEKN